MPRWGGSSARAAGHEYQQREQRVRLAVEVAALLLELLGVRDLAPALVPRLRVRDLTLREAYQHAPPAGPIPQREFALGAAVGESTVGALLAVGVPRRERADRATVAEVGLARFASVAMPRGPVAVRASVAKHARGLLDAALVRQPRAMLLVGEIPALVLLEAVAVPAGPHSVLLAVQIRAFGRLGAGAGPRRPHALAHAVAVLALAALAVLPHRPAAMLAALAILALALLGALEGPHGPSTVLLAVAVLAFFLLRRGGIPRRIGPVTDRAHLAPAGVTAWRSVTARARGARTGEGDRSGRGGRERRHLGAVAVVRLGDDPSLRVPRHEAAVQLAVAIRAFALLHAALEPERPAPVVLSVPFVAFLAGASARIAEDAAALESPGPIAPRLRYLASLVVVLPHPVVLAVDVVAFRGLQLAGRGPADPPAVLAAVAVVAFVQPRAIRQEEEPVACLASVAVFALRRDAPVVVPDHPGALSQPVPVVTVRRPLPVRVPRRPLTALLAVGELAFGALRTVRMPGHVGAVHRPAAVGDRCATELFATELGGVLHGSGSARASGATAGDDVGLLAAAVVHVRAASARVPA